MRLHLADGEEEAEEKICAAARAGCPVWLVLESDVPCSPKITAALGSVPLWISCSVNSLDQMQKKYPTAMPVNIQTGSSDIYAFVRKALELWGSRFVLYASAQCKTLEHAVANWYHARAALARVLTERYRCLLYAGWNLSASEIAEDVAHMSGTSAMHCLPPPTTDRLGGGRTRIAGPAGRTQTRPRPTPASA